MNTILVTGGTGYIGSHTMVDLIDHGFNVVCADNQSNSSLSVLDGVEKITGKRPKNYSIDLCDRYAVMQMFEETKIDGVIHFAALKSVNESVSQPIRYYQNNINSQLNVLEAMAKYGVKHFIFSSSCSVYGNTKALPVVESTPFEEAECPYARTKQIGEQLIYDTARANDALHSVILRYFNPAGAHHSAIIGEESRNKATNLVPVITETAIGKRDSMTVFGTDYDTRDGSCIRDYIHVMDLANAHTKALQYLINANNNERVEVFNLGIGQGATVLEAINAFEKTSGKKLNYSIGDRRAGDVVAIYADNAKAINELKWQPKFSIEDIMDTAWKWELKRTNN